MVLVLFALLLVVSLFVNQDQRRIQHEFMIVPVTAVSIPSPSPCDAEMPIVSLIVPQPFVDPPRIRIQATTTKSAPDHRESQSAHGSNNVRFSATKINDVMAMTMFMDGVGKSHASYDMGQNQYSHPDIRAGLHAKRRSAISSEISANRISHPSIEETGSAAPGQSSGQSSAESRYNRMTPNSRMFSGEHWTQSGAERTGIAKVFVGAMTEAMAVAIPIQTFINQYSTYDSGKNANSYPAVHIKSNVSTGSAHVSAQLRF